MISKLNLKAGNWFIIIASLVLYGYHNLLSLAWLAGSILFTYLFSVLITKKPSKGKLFLVISVSANVLLLIAFKIPGFFEVKADNIESFFMPLALSFITFSQIAYLVNVYKKSIKNYGLQEYLLYVTYFPKLLMGPITEPGDLIDQFYKKKKKKPDIKHIVAGLRLMSFGLFKKVILADTFAKAVNWGFVNPSVLSSADIVLVMLCYTFEIYFDFSGYSDMAIGLSMILNINLPINFNSPYKSTSIQDFWKRWHISLTSFLTKYVYIPLGGNRKGTFRTYINILIVFLVSGFWHGSNWTFVLWGVLHGLLMIYDRYAYKFRQKLSDLFTWICTFISINILWLLFRAESIKQWWTMLGVMIKCESTALSQELVSIFELSEIRLLLNTFFKEDLLSTLHLLYPQIFIIAAFIICLVPKNAYETKKDRSVAGAVLAALALVFGILGMVGESTFIYQNF
ncbi:MAG: MBOAT family protein [Lachnospiraceae bacterium]|nr:MBOAT family protein [Lachnospiraceae bacterium]